MFSNVATTTLLAVLALWVGGLASYLVLRAVSAKALSSMRSSWRLTLENLAPTAVVAALQAVILTVLLSTLLDLGATSTARVLGLALLAGLVFAALNQALVAWFGGVGRFVSVVLVVLTAAGAITSAVPEIFDSVTPLLPLTPALRGLRAVAAGSGTGGGAAAPARGVARGRAGRRRAGHREGNGPYACRPSYPGGPSVRTILGP